MLSHLRTVLKTTTSNKLTIRPIHATPLSRLPYKDSQDRQSLRPGRNENTKSGRDDDVASNRPDVAFSPNEPKPEQAAAKSSRKDNGDPLEVSGANRDVSQPAEQTGAGQEVSKGGASKGKSSQKKGTLPRD
ncbi:hypothetical protein BGZ63DRAFT_421642 [Mariannaea sp. PMI_226]|nr:hypothetical protein BGZ63DRAFT_421642 [Mariannaea sp. PMI_226]